MFSLTLKTSWQMPRIILIETSTSLCSTAIADEGRIVSSRRSDAPRVHASMTAPFVKEMLDECGWSVKDCDAVCVSMGPGSYTGLRVGVSTAKGLCFGADIPLLAVSSLDILARQAIEAGLPEGCSAILPVLDARRMEVYTAPYSPGGKRLEEIAPVVVGPDSFAELFAAGPVAIVGDAAEKCRILPAASFLDTCPEAEAMLIPALERFEEGRYENVAYFEPFYLKQFVATISKKNLF